MTMTQRDSVDYADELRGDMRISEGRDPVALIGIGITILVNLAGMAWIAGKFDQRMATAERDIIELKAKADKDGQQDVQIATISVQLATIQSGVAEIKTKLETRK